MTAHVNVDAEQSVIGALISDADCLYRFEIRADEFATPGCRLAYEAICGLVFEHGGAVDPITVAAEMRRRGATDDGLEAALVDMAARVPTPENVGHYAGIVRRLATQRKLVAELGALQRLAIDADPEQVVGLGSEIQKRLMRAGSVRARIQRVGVAAGEVMADVEAGRAPIAKVKTGIGKLDSLIGGLPVGNIALIAARPAQGKSTLARRIAYRQAESGVKVGYLSFEENHRQFSTALMCTTGLVDSFKAVQGTLNAAERYRMGRAREMVEPLPLFVCDERPLTPEQAEARLRQMKTEHGIQVGFVDYWNRLLLPGRHDRTDEASVVVSKMAGIAADLGIALVVVAQLNRQNETEGRRPSMRDLKETGSWEESAFTILLLNRPSEQKATEPRDLAEVIVAKNKLGPTGLVKLGWCGKYLWIDDGPPPRCTDGCPADPRQCQHKPDLDYRPPAPWGEEEAA